MLAPTNPGEPPAGADYESLLAASRFEALMTLRRLLTDPPESPAAARELRMTATAILRILPSAEPGALAPPPRRRQRPEAPPQPAPPAEPAPPIVHDTAPSSDPFHGLSPDETIRRANAILFPRRKPRSAAAALTSRAGGACAGAADSS